MREEGDLAGQFRARRVTSTGLAVDDQTASELDHLCKGQVMGKLRVGTVYRYSRPYSADPHLVDGLQNFFHQVASPRGRLPLVEAGINPIGAVDAGDGTRCPAILISSSPHKTGSDVTPWQDRFDVDNGCVRYFGDNKSSATDPATRRGNTVLLRQFEIHTSPDPDVRQAAVPILFLERVTHGGRAKGNIRFQGLGVLQRAERVTQYNQGRREYFTNYVFEFCVLSLSRENEELDWEWIRKRQDRAMSIPQTLPFAPASWQQWIKRGNDSIEELRRRVSTLEIASTSEQQPQPGSKESAALRTIYAHYSDRRHVFEALASRVAAKIVGRDGVHYREGWITPPSGDHGADFVARIDLGSGFAQARLVVLGQAKCEKLDAPTNGVHVARTVARLKRGWVGVYVTTSYFSRSMQAEVIEDQYPIVLVNGMELARTVLNLAHEAGVGNLNEYLDQVDTCYKELVRRRRPEEVLLE